MEGGERNHRLMFFIIIMVYSYSVLDSYNYIIIVCVCLNTVLGYH